MNFRENMASLRTLSNDHYQNRISFAEYREQRTQLLNLIDEELNGITIDSKNSEIEEIKDASFVDKALSFLNLDKLKETN